MTIELGVLDPPPVSTSSPETPSPVPRKPHPVLQFPINLLHGSDTCEDTKGLHDLIRKKFTDIMGTHFQPVPANSDFFFYCPPNFHDDDAEVRLLFICFSPIFTWLVI